MKHVLLATLAFASVAHAHFKLSSDAGFPQDWLQVDGTGDPVGGNQKTNPCGAGTNMTNAVMTVTAGSQLALEWTETVGHPGWYRVAIAQDRADLPAPVASDANCTDATVEDPVVAPVIADNLFPHTQPQQNHVYDTTVTVPGFSCDACTLQVVEFMKNHGPPNCFYYHCATLKIVPAQTGTGGGTAGAGGGAAGTGGGAMAAGGGTTGATGGGTASGGSTGTGGSSSATGGSTSGTGGSSSATGGGNKGGDINNIGGCTSAGGEAVGLLALGTLLAMLGLKRRRS